MAENDCIMDPHALREEIYVLADEKYRAFHASIVPGMGNFVPDLFLIP